MTKVHVTDYTTALRVGNTKAKKIQMLPKL